MVYLLIGCTRNSILDIAVAYSFRRKSSRASMAMQEIVATGGRELIFPSVTSFTSLPTTPYRRSSYLSHGSGVEHRPEPRIRESPVTDPTAGSVTGGSYAAAPYRIPSSRELRRNAQLRATNPNALSSRPDNASTCARDQNNRVPAVVAFAGAGLSSISIQHLSEQIPLYRLWTQL